MPDHYQPLNRSVRPEVSSLEIYAFIKRMRLVRDGEVKLAHLLEEQSKQASVSTLSPETHIHGSGEPLNIG